jgi:2,5-diamino-6-(ribosylamino)-4(3H)-pyrimidinone 5'-phosphate reductase
LEEGGIRYLCKKAKKLFIVVTNQNHLAHELKEELPNIEVIQYETEIDFADLFRRLKEQYGMEKMTVQTGGTINTTLIRLGLIDHLSLVVAPVLIGGKDTPTLVDGESLHTTAELHNLKPLKLVKCEELEHSYLHLQYDVMNG